MEKAREMVISEQIRFASAYGTIITDDKTVEAIATAFREAEARGRKHGPMHCSSCGTVSPMGGCDCVNGGRPEVANNMRYIAVLHNELDRIEEAAFRRGRASMKEEAAKVADQEAADWTAEHEFAQKQTGTFGILSGVLSAAATNRAAGARDVAAAIRALREGDSQPSSHGV